MSFHKPRVYRSLAGCCICKAKSSSSRFTDCEKYKDAFFSCFKLTEDREGDICNACVLLVKRFRKLPKTSKKHWSHVVDARAGPGVKSFVKRPKVEKVEVIKHKKHVYKKKKKPPPLQDIDDLVQSDSNERQTDSPARQTDSPVRQTDSPISNYSDETLGSDGSRAHTPVDRVTRARTPVELSRARRSLAVARMRTNLADSICGFFDSSMWKREETCCGAIFRGPFGEVMIDRRFYRPCTSSRHRATAKPTSDPSSGHRYTETPTAIPPVENLLRTENALVTTAKSALVTDTTAEKSVSLANFPLVPTAGAEVSKMDIDDVSMTSSCSSSKSTAASTPTSFESLIESELKAFGLESEASVEEPDENIDFYCSESMTDLKAGGGGQVAPSDDIDEGFFDKPTSRQENSLRLSCESPSLLSL